MLLQLVPQLSVHPQLVALSHLQVGEGSGAQLPGRGTPLYSSLATLKSPIFIFLSIFVVFLSSLDIFHCRFCFSLNKESYIGILLPSVLLSPGC